jgi:23S rRNA pseudouridine1911/1915/1917 synthase
MLLKADRPCDLKTFLAGALGISKSKAKALIDTKSVFVNERRAWIATFEVKKGDTVETPDRLPAKPPETLKILYEDEKIIAVDKPAGIVADEDGASLEALVRRQFNDKKIRAAHRLDKETSGVMLFARSDADFEEVMKLWEDKAVKKTYLALAKGEAKFESKTISSLVDGKEAKSEVTALSTAEELTLFKIEAITGRKHQVRVHLASAGHPLAGEKQYAGPSVKNELLRSAARQMLHAYILEAETPWAGRIKIKSPLPGDFRRLAAQAGIKTGKL